MIDATNMAPSCRAVNGCLRCVMNFVEHRASVFDASTTNRGWTFGLFQQQSGRVKAGDLWPGLRGRTASGRECGGTLSITSPAATGGSSSRWIDPGVLCLGRQLVELGQRAVEQEGGQVRVGVRPPKLSQPSAQVSGGGL